jgi:UDPglucose--hexose-1-phosphate uridylyltransferase
VAVAPARGTRPGARHGGLEPATRAELETCPFCEGREERTPPETYASGPPGREANSPGWSVRVVPNLYPVFERQEVVIDVPRHARSLVELSDAELELVADAWQARAAAGEGGYLHAFVNEGRDAGASLMHSHSQLAWLPETPPALARERSRSLERCRLCALLDEERQAGTRVVAERAGLVCLCPYASRLPYELLVAPRRHETDPWRSDLLAPALALAADGLRRLHSIEGARPANLWLHAEGHWHLEILPRLAVFAGLELGAGIYVCSLAPEDAAAALRSATA